MPVNGCCALTQVLSVSLHSKRGKPVSHRNLHCDLSITPSASPSCKRNCPAISAAASVPLICSLAETATKIAGFRAASLGELLHVFRADQFLDGGGEVFGGDFHKISAAGFERLCFFRQFVQLL